MPKTCPNPISHNKMKNNNNNSGSNIFKRIVSVICAIAKSQTIAVKTKTSSIKTRLLVFNLLRNKKLSLGSISHKLHAILGHQDHTEDDDQSKAIVLYNALATEPTPSSVGHGRWTHEDDDDDDDDQYPDLRHCLFEDDDMDLGDPNGSAIEMARNEKEEGEDFKLEDEIDHVADLFIMKFHKRMKLQKLESFKRYQDMLDRST